MLPKGQVGSLLLGDHLVGMHSAAGADDLDELLDIEGNTVKVQTRASSLYGGNGIFVPAIEMELVFGLEDVIVQADAAWIEEQSLADASHLLHVGVTTRHDSSAGITALACSSKNLR